MLHSFLSHKYVTQSYSKNPFLYPHLENSRLYKCWSVYIHQDVCLFTVCLILLWILPGLHLPEALGVWSSYIFHTNWIPSGSTTAAWRIHAWFSLSESFLKGTSGEKHRWASTRERGQSRLKENSLLRQYKKYKMQLGDTETVYDRGNCTLSLRSTSFSHL